MKENINIFEYAGKITEALGKGGILLNSKADKFNSMVIGWAGIGRCWNKPVFTVYVRENRYTKPQIDQTGEFTVSIPDGGADPLINKVCGSQSGKDIDKVKEAGLTLEEPLVIDTPGICEYPITLECKVLYSQRQNPSMLPYEIFKGMYPQDVDGSAPMGNRDPHTEYIAEIVAAYIIR